MRAFFLLVFLAILTQTTSAQLMQGRQNFTRADTLRGMLTPLRTCYDVKYYHLDVRVDLEKKALAGSTLFQFLATQNFKRLQFDLFANLAIDDISFNAISLKYTREFNAVFVDFPEEIKKGTIAEFKVTYRGLPVIAKNAPWDGGFVFSKDAAGKPWVAVACQGIGASLWWPNKDHQSDEPDSMLISVSVPNGLMNISNGTLRSVEEGTDNYNKYNWFISYPINNYGVTLNIADYAHFSDTFEGLNGKLPLNFYVLKENLNKAKTHFKADVKPMLRAFEYWFGPYPFYRDGYKLVETPYLGLENQSAVAYGNNYKKGYSGRDWSDTGLGLDWDFLIIHESGHEWFGNNITSKDIADMWIHESFTCYSEALFVESKSGKQAATQYIKGIRRNIRNDTPIIGPYNVNKEGSGDMYFKGANILHTIRTIIDDDEKWRGILQGLNRDFGLQTTTTEEVVSYISRKSGKDLQKIFDQYLRHSNPPILEVEETTKGSTRYRWLADVKSFKMPLRIKSGPELPWKTITISSEWCSVKTQNVIVDTDNFYIQVRKVR
jgi:aminopeptidase N